MSAAAGEPLVSVIIPVYNGERFLRPALESIQAQDYKPLEVVVVDDGSTDSSAEICRDFPGVRYFRQENAGTAAAKNKGLEEARGEWIAFHDADDLCPPQKITQESQALREHPEWGYVLAMQENFLEPGCPSPSWFEEEKNLKNRLGFIVTALIRRDVFQKVGVFDASYTIGEDVDWLVRARDAGISYGTLDEVLLMRRIHDRNLSSGVSLGRKNLMRILRSSVERKKKQSSKEGGETV